MGFKHYFIQGKLIDYTSVVATVVFLSFLEFLQFRFSSFCKGARETFATSWQSDWAASWEAKACKTFRWEETSRCSISRCCVSRCKNIQVGACKQSPANSFNIPFLDNVLCRWGGETASWTSRSQWTSPTAPASTPLFCSPRFHIEQKDLIKSWQKWSLSTFSRRYLIQRTRFR